MSTPVEQFKIVPILSLEFGSIDLSFTNSALAMVLAVSGAVVLYQFALWERKLIPGRWQGMVELVYEFIYGMVKSNLGDKGERYFPFIFVLFNFILVCNLLGLIPYSFTATSHIIVTFTLSFSIFLAVTIIAFATHGSHFFAFFLPEGVPMVIAPFMIVIELISYVARPFSLGVRLFANMMSGHALLKIMAGFSWTILHASGAIFLVAFVPIVFLVIFTGLELAICCIQAYVFAILTVLYLKDSIYMH